MAAVLLLPPPLLLEVWYVRSTKFQINVLIARPCAMCAMSRVCECRWSARRAYDIVFIWRISSCFDYVWISGMKFISHLDKYFIPYSFASDECMSGECAYAQLAHRNVHNCRLGCCSSSTTSTTSINDEICFNYVHKITFLFASSVAVRHRLQHKFMFLSLLNYSHTHTNTK